MVTQVAKYVFGVPKVVARVYQPHYAPIFRRFGIDIVNPIELSMAAFVDSFVSGNRRERELAQEEEKP